MKLRTNGNWLIVVLSATGLLLTTAPVHAKRTVKKTANCVPLHVKQNVKQPASPKGAVTPVAVNKKLTTLNELQIHDASLLAELENNELKK